MHENQAVRTNEGRRRQPRTGSFRRPRKPIREDRIVLVNPTAVADLDEILVNKYTLHPS